MWTGNDEIDASLARVDLDAVWKFLHQHSNWSTWRTRDDVQRQVEGAWRVAGCYDKHGRMVGFARAFSDSVATASPTCM